MTKGSTGSGQSASKPVATCGIAIVTSAPVKTTVSFEGAKGRGGGEGIHQTKSTVSYGDKQSGCYGRETTTQKASAGDFQWKNGTTGTRSEYKESATVRVGDKSGYTEVYSEQRVRNVSYNQSTNSSKGYSTYNNDNKSTTGSGSSSSKDYIIYDNGHGGRGYGGYY